jgi:Protein of unknown function (DUF1552)
MPRRRLPRRTLLRGACGAAVALPLLECMMPERQAQAADPPKRYFVGFGGFSLNVDQSPGAHSLVPDTVGANWDVKQMLAPLNGYADANGAPVKERISVVSGLDIPHASDVNAMPPGSRYPGDSFHFHGNAMLCGLQQQGELDGSVTGMSSDQIVADAIGQTNIFESLVYRAQALFYNTGGGTFDKSHHRDTLSFDTGGQAIAARTSPKSAYESLFTSFTPEDPVEAVAKELELLKRKSILDHVDRSINGLLPQLSAWDRQRMDRHYDEIRALEQLLEATGPEQNANCMLLPHPGDDPPLGGEFGQPFAWNVNDGYSNEEARARVLTRLMHMAFVCDLTRVGTFMYTMFQSFMNAHPLVGASYNVHALNHLGQQTQHAAMIQWHMDHFGELVAMLRDTPEAGGSVLDNCAMAFLIEGGFRSATTTVPGGHSHTTENMACLVAGGAGGLKQGHHVVAPNGANHPCNVLVSLMNAAGVDVTSLGDVQGAIGDLFG